MSMVGLNTIYVNKRGPKCHVILILSKQGVCIDITNLTHWGRDKMGAILQMTN